MRPSVFSRSVHPLVVQNIASRVHWDTFKPSCTTPTAPTPRSTIPAPAVLLPITDGGTLRTIGEACDYMTAMNKQREVRQRWQRAAKLILAKADVVTVSRALELALFMDAKLDVSKVPAG
jgi:hypothetical protein